MTLSSSHSDFGASPAAGGGAGIPVGVPEGELWLSGLVQRMPAIFWTTDRDLVCTAALGRGLELLGPSAKAFVGTSVLEYCEHDASAPPVRDHRRALEGETLQADYELAGRVLRTYLAPRRDGRGEIIGCVGAAIDVTEAVAAERKLREASERLADLGKHVPGLMYQTIGSPRGETLAVPFMSDRTREYLGVEPQEVMADPTILARVVHPDDLSEFLCKADESFRNLTLFVNECRVIARDGRQRWMHIVSQPRRLPDGNVLYNGLCLDITDRRKAEAEVQRLNAELEQRVAARTAELTQAKSEAEEARRFISSVANATPAVLYVYDLERSCNVFTNARLGEMLGYSKEEAERPGTRIFEDNFHPDDRPAIAAAHRHYSEARDGEVVFTEYRLRHASGQYRWLRNADIVFERKPDGSPCKILGLAQDITEFKLSQEAILSEQRLLRKLLEIQDRERRTITYDIHDGLVQQMIAAQMRLSGLASRDSGLSAEVEAEIEVVERLIGRAIEDARRLIGDLRPMVLENRGLTEAIDDLVQDAAELSGIHIRFRRQGDTPRLPDDYQANVFRIAQEAINNIRRHSQASEADVNLICEAGRLKLEIRDQGVGFVLENVPADRFGLAGIRERARLFGGGAEFITSPGEGTTIRVSIPLPPPNPSHAAEALLPAG